MSSTDEIAKLAPTERVQLPSFAGVHCRNRRIEWWLAFATLLEGALLCLWPQAMKESAFAPLVDLVRSDVFAVLCVLVGLSRLVALFYNGKWPFWGAVIRSSGALATGVFIFLPLTLSLITLSIESRSTPAVGIPIFFVLFLSELDTALRAAADVRSSRFQ